MKIEIKKEKIVMAITIGIACFTLMLVMFMQFKVVRQTDITAIESMRESELRVELSSWNEKYKELNEKYQETIAKISEYKDERESNEKTTQLLEKELAQLNQSLGKTDVEGEGIAITITDNGGKELSEDVIVNISEQNLLLIVNELLGAGAEAISINDKRIVAMSDIVTVGESIYLKVNGDRIKSPYIIKAIGNVKFLESAVSGKGSQVSELKDLGHDISINTSNKIKINKYEGTISTKYID